MKRAAQHGAGGDDGDDDTRNVRNPSAAMNQTAARNAHVPRVIRNAVDGARDQPPPAGYSPAVTLQMAGAHCWARYGDVVSALRSLTNLNLLETPAREAARATVRGLYQHPTPFDAGVRFPDAELYLSIDHGKFGQCVSKIQKELLRVEAARMYDSGRIVPACEALMEAVGFAVATATLTWEEEPGKPVVYDRAVFEEAFQLTWTEARATEILSNSCLSAPANAAAALRA